MTTQENYDRLKSFEELSTNKFGVYIAVSLGVILVACLVPFIARIVL